MDNKNNKNSRTEVAPEKLALLAEASRALNSSIEYEPVMKTVLQLITRAVNAEAALVYRYDSGRRDLRAYFYSGNENFRPINLQMGQGFAGWVAQNREPIMINDAPADKRYDSRLNELQDIELRSLICFPLTLRGRFFGVIEAINKKDDLFDDSDMDTIQLLSDQISMTIHNANLYRNIRRQALQRTTLFEVSRNLMSPLTLDEVLYNILTALKRVFDYNAGGVYVVDSRSGNIDSIKSIGYDKIMENDLHLKIGQGIVGYVARTGKAEIVPDVSKDNRYINAREETRSEVVVPIKADGNMIGAFNLESDQLDAFTRKDVELLSAFASHAALAIERARLMRLVLEQKKIEEQLSIARTIQKSFLPDTLPRIDRFDIWGTNIPSGEVGGDYFDFIQIVENQLGIAIADVSGKGIPASLIMAAFRASLIAEIRNNYAIRTICSKVNNLMYESLEQGNFVTGIYGVLDSKNSIFTFSNCGHNPGLLIRRDGSVEELTEGGMLWGIKPDVRYEERPMYLITGDILCLFTDGITEAEHSSGQQFESERLVSLIQKNNDLTSADLGKKILDEIHEFAKEGPPPDDLTLIIIKRLP